MLGIIIMSSGLSSSQEITNTLLFFLVFGLLYYGSSLQSHMKNLKKKHPSIVLISAFFFGYFIIYEVVHHIKLIKMK